MYTLTLTLSLRRKRENIFKAISPLTPSSKKRGNPYTPPPASYSK
jgi:hypothetical protein